MRSARRAALVAAVLAFTVQFARPAHAFHTIFHFMVDRVEVDGNPYGPLDGTPDVVDEFDDGDLVPWSVLFGTAYERQGFLHLTNPGTHYNVVVPLDLSDVVGMTALRSGLGSFRYSRCGPPPAFRRTT
jgi:hypothetical protein